MSNIFSEIKIGTTSPNTVFAVRFAHPNAPSGHFAYTEHVRRKCLYEVSIWEN
jgi:hypothetical protein